MIAADDTKSEDDTSDSEEEDVDKVKGTMEKLTLKEGGKVNGETEEKKTDNSTE